MYTHVLQQHQIVHPRLVWFWPDHSFQGGLMKFITDNALHTSITASKVLPLPLCDGVMQLQASRPKIPLVVSWEL